MRNSLVMVVLAALAVATWLYGRQPTAPQRAAVNEGGAPLGYYLREAKLLGTDDQGRVAYRILADNLEELPDQQLLKLEGVRIEYHPPDGDPWLISADAGSAPKDGTELTLRGSVTLRSEPKSGHEPMVIAAEALRFVPGDSSAESDTPVSIKVGDWYVNAVGLRTRLKGDVVQLESKVHAKFAQ